MPRGATVLVIDPLDSGSGAAIEANAVQQVAEGAGFSVVREYVGHGVGRALHSERQRHGQAPFAAARTMTRPPLGPGMAPLMSSRPRSTPRARR